MTQPNRVSVIVPTRDTRDLTLACIDAIRSAGPDEVILVDDGGRDDTGALVRDRFRDVQMIRLPIPEGFTRAANRGLAAATGDILLLLNSDTEIAPGSLDALRAAIVEEPSLGIAGASLSFPDGTPQWSGGRQPTPWWVFGLASGLPGLLARLPGYRVVRPVSGDSSENVEWVTGAALAMRREVWDRCGPLDEMFHFYCQDLDLCLRARDAGFSVRIVSEFKVMHHQGATIRLSSGRASPLDPSLLWGDLVRWAGKRHGPAGTRRFARALQVGGRVRLLVRRLVRLALFGETRHRWDRENLTYSKALETVSSLADEIRRTASN